MSEAASQRRPVVCIVILYAWPLFEAEAHGAFGGSEVRLAAIARGLEGRGKFDIRIAIWDHGTGVTVRDGITFHPWPEREPIANEAASATERKFKPIRSIRQWAARGGWTRLALAVPLLAVRAYAATVGLTERISRIRNAAGRIGEHVVARSRCHAMTAINPDVVVVHGANSVSADVVFWCRKNDRPCLLLCGSDNDVDARYKESPRTRSPYGDIGAAISFAIENATACAVQTERQAEMVATTYGRTVEIIRNPSGMERNFPREEDPACVLWVGKADAVKRPEIALDLATRIPNARFVMVINPSDPEIAARCLERAKSLPNVEVLQTVAFDQIESLFARAAVFLNTSAFEGFPNTFLQAAKYEVPIASLVVNPGGMLSSGAGCSADGSFETLERELRSLLDDEIARRKRGAAGLAYLRAHHDPEPILQRLEDQLSSLLRSASVK